MAKFWAEIFTGFFKNKFMKVLKYDQYEILPHKL